MKNTIKFLAGIAFIAVIVFSMAACGDGGGSGEADPALNGTWVDEDDVELILNNGSFEVSGQAKGSYTTSGNNITIKLTHINLGTGWKTKAQVKELLKTIYGGTITDAQIDEYLNEMFASHTGTYSVNGNALTLTQDGETTTFTKKGSSTGSGSGSGSGTNTSLNGTWVDEDDVELILNNGSFEVPGEMKGSYTTSDNNITMTPTHVHGNTAMLLGLLESRWYTKAQLKSALQAELDSWNDTYEAELNDMFSPRTGTYYLNGDTLIMTIGENEPITYTRQ